MTAIASLYVRPGFVIAADGRCKSDNPALSTKFETEYAQKLFPIQNDDRTFVYSLIGFAGTNDGKFKMVDEISKVAATLANRRFDDCGLYIHNFCHHLQRVLGKARRAGRISEFPSNDHLPPEKKNNICRLLIVGYFRQRPWQFEIRFLHENQTHVRFAIDSSAQPDRITAAITGSDIVANAMYQEHDPRFAQYVKPYNVDTLEQASDYVRGYIAACSDPIALELDPLCAGIGGHIHIAAIARDGGFRWIAPPISSR
jgi:hypothetical protein